MSQQNLDIGAILREAETGNATAQYLLGWIYGTGKHLPKDDVQSFYWYKKAAESGEIRSKKALQFMYLKGLGTSKDITKSIEWGEQLALKGDALTQARLGIAYLSLDDDLNNKQTAFAWISVALDSGHKSILTYLVWLYLRFTMPSDSIKISQDIIRMYKNKIQGVT